MARDCEDDGAYPSAPYDFPDWCSRCQKRHHDDPCPVTLHEERWQTLYTDRAADLVDPINGTAAWMLRERVNATARISDETWDMSDAEIGAMLRELVTVDGVRLIVVNEKATI